VEQLRRFLVEQKQNVSVNCNHDINSTSCSGNIVSIQVICKCVELPSNMHNQENNSSDLLIPINVSSSQILKIDVKAYFSRMNRILMLNKDRSIIHVVLNLN